MSGSLKGNSHSDAIHPKLLVGPRWASSPASSAAAVGTLDAEFPAVLDDAGLLTPSGADWSLDWWIGGDDRWYFPSQESTVRQRRLGPGPVIETSMRIPSGDAVTTVYGSRSASENGEAVDVVVVEITNRSPVPVAVAMAIRPYRSTGEYGAGLESQRSSVAIEQLDATTISIAGLKLLLPRAAGGSTSSANTDVVDTFEQGRQLDGLGPVSGASATAAVMFPLPHSTTLRFVLADRSVEVDRLPDAESVSRGWGSMVNGGARFSTPDDGVEALLGAARARMLMGSADAMDELDHVVLGGRGSSHSGLLGRLRSQSNSDVIECDGGAGDIVAALAVGGHWDGVQQALSRLADAPRVRCTSPGPGSRLIAGSALAAALWLADDRERAEDLAQGLLEPLTGLTTQVAKLSDRQTNSHHGHHAVAFAGLGLLCDALGQEDASTDLRARIEDWSPAGDPALAVWRSVDLAHLVGLGQQASEAGSWPEPDRGCQISRPSQVDSLAGAARYANSVRSLLVAEDLSGSIELLPNFPTAWRGGAVEVHEAPTLYGRLSYAIRWHGARPALLWELSNSTNAQRTITLRCRSLDPEWSSTASSGETLLAGTQAGLADAPRPGDSFS